MAKMILEFDFEIDPEEDDYRHLILEKIKCKNGEDLTIEDRHTIAESWAQSDYYWVGITNAIISAIGDDMTITKEDIDY